MLVTRRAMRDRIRSLEAQNAVLGQRLSTEQGESQGLRVQLAQEKYGGRITASEILGSHPRASLFGTSPRWPAPGSLSQHPNPAAVGEHSRIIEAFDQLSSVRHQMERLEKGLEREHDRTGELDERLTAIRPLVEELHGRMVPADSPELMEAALNTKLEACWKRMERMEKEHDLHNHPSHAEVKLHAERIEKIERAYVHVDDFALTERNTAELISDVKKLNQQANGARESRIRFEARLTTLEGQVPKWPDPPPAPDTPRTPTPSE